jgi:hypothetical protein
MLDPVYWLAQYEEASGALRLVGKAAAWLRRGRRPRMRTGGFEFFSDRESLIRAYGILAARLASVSSASVMWVVGQKFYDSDENADRIKRLLLPNPNGEAFKRQIATGPHHTAGDELKRITRRAQQKGAKVKWYDGFVHHIILADVEKPSGWVHVESVLPHSKTDQRPSWTLHKRASEKTVLEMKRIFDEIWDEAKEPTFD